MIDFIKEARALFPYTQSMRRDFHIHPELGFHEIRTGGIVARELEGLGLEVTKGIGKTGVVDRMKYAPVVCILLLAACASTGPISTPVPPMPPSATPLPITATVERCAYVEAYQSLSGLTAQVDQAIKQIQPDASGRAEAYGENCVYASSGQATFSAMETDFYFTIPVKDLKDDNELGTWIINTMKIVEALPASSSAGPQAGFVEFTFKTKDDQKNLRVQIGNYESLPANINANEIIPTLFPSP